MTCCWCDAPATHVLVTMLLDGREWRDPACSEHTLAYQSTYLYTARIANSRKAFRRR